ncbi:replication endonuclease [Paraburkholderia fungorum]|uniref:replication endonuclease n=1 Tax=Paraburkholderia fungorum TaxID=134537 RepID=UPI0038B80E46
MTKPLRSTDGVDALIARVCAGHELELLARTYSPLFPGECPWKALADIPELLAQRDATRLNVIARELRDYRADLSATADRLARYLSASEADIRDLAMRCAKLRLPNARKLHWAERILGTPVPGDSLTSQLARVDDARFWRRAIRTRVLREREHLFLRLGLIGARREKYVSSKQLKTRLDQLKRQAKWMKDTVLLPRYLTPDDAEKDLLTLADVSASPKSRFAKLYTFTRAMDELAQEAGLSAAMLTLTLEPEWHPNPSHGANQWGGANPRDAHGSLAKRWQSILRDLDRAGIGLSGLRVVEPHQDGCPHWHIWLLYRPDAETMILATVMKYFPKKLKVRAPSRKGDKQHAADRMFNSRDDLLAGTGRPVRSRKEGAQVELSRIVRSISSGPGYAMKYLLKTVDAGDELNDEVGLLPDAKDAAGKEAQRKKHRRIARRVDAYRSLWGFNAAQLFGVAKCLTAWDELRRLPQAPEPAELRHLWTLARGSDQEGRIGAGTGQRGNAKGFIQALGGLAACGKAPKDASRRSIGRLTDTAVNGYGDTIMRTVGVTLVERARQRVTGGSRVSRRTGEIREKLVWRSVTTVVAQVRTRLTEWILAPKRTLPFALALAKARFAGVMRTESAT